MIQNPMDERKLAFKLILNLYFLTIVQNDKFNTVVCLSEFLRNKDNPEYNKAIQTIKENLYNQEFFYANAPTIQFLSSLFLSKLEENDETGFIKNLTDLMQFTFLFDGFLKQLAVLLVKKFNLERHMELLISDEYTKKLESIIYISDTEKMVERLLNFFDEIYALGEQNTIGVTIQ